MALNKIYISDKYEGRTVLETLDIFDIVRLLIINQTQEGIKNGLGIKN